MLIIMCSLQKYTTTLLSSCASVHSCIPVLRLEKPMSSTWRSYLMFNRSRIRPQNYYGTRRRLIQFTHNTCFGFQRKMFSGSVWRSQWMCHRWRYGSVGAECLTFHKATTNNYEPNRHLSDTKMTQTRKRVSKKMEEIKENILTIPNGLCFLRMVATPFLGYLVLQEWYATSLGLFIFAGCTDVVDGYIARTYPSQQSMIGSFLDPAADKILIATLFITLTFNGLIPVPLTSLIILRDICLMGAGFYIRYVSLPPPKTLTRYFDMSFVTAKLSPTGISKLNTLVQLSLVACSLAAPVFDFTDHIYLQTLWYVTAVSTVLSAGSYLCYKDTYKVFASHVGKRR